MFIDTIVSPEPNDKQTDIVKWNWSQRILNETHLLQITIGSEYFLN